MPKVTARLTARVRKLGLKGWIMEIKNNPRGKYFLYTSQEDKIPLGYSEKQSRAMIDQIHLYQS